MKPKAQLDVLSISDMCVDLILRGNVRPEFGQVETLVDSYAITLGGSANIFACQVSKLGGQAGVIGHVGDDTFGETVLTELKHCGVNVDWVYHHPTLKTGLGVALSEPSDRAILTVQGTINSLRWPDIPQAALTSARHWHIASYYLLEKLQSGWLLWMKELRQAGVTISLDTNWAPTGDWSGVRKLLPLVDIFFPNQAEACAIAEKATVEDAGRELAKQVPLVVIKCDTDGTVAFRGKKMSRVTPISPPPVIADTIGAGDSFDGGFIHAWLQGEDLAACLHQAVRCGEASLREVGGIAGQLSGVLT